MAWLAIAALWLAIVAPVVSRTLANTADWPELAAWCGIHHDGGDPAAGQPHGHPLEKCGYCGLLAGHPLLPGMAPQPPAPLSFAPLPLQAPAFRAPAANRSLAAAPRGPPPVVRA